MPDATAARAPLVLLANAQEWFSRSLESILRPAGYTVLKAYTSADALQSARRTRPDVVILDTELPDANAFALCHALRADSALTAGTPILITTPGPILRQQMLDALRAGANDFWGQPLDTEEFLLRLQGHLRAKGDADGARAEGLVDARTGLYNAQGLARRARELGAQADREGAPLACLVLAVDRRAPEPSGSKRRGGDGSDSAVDAVGRRLRAAARLCDATGRLGPTEFAVLAPLTNREGATKLGERLASTLAVGPTLRLRGGYDVVTGFRGASLDPTELLSRARDALRAAETDEAGPWMRPFEDGARGPGAPPPLSSRPPR